MPPRRSEARLRDMLQAIEKTERYVANLSFEEFKGDEKTVDAVLKNMVVLGEAARALPEDLTSKYPEVPWAEARGMRHVVVHQYFGVSLKIVWETITRDLPELRSQLEAILAEMD